MILITDLSDLYTLCHGALQGEAKICLGALQSTETWVVFAVNHELLSPVITVPWRPVC